MQRTLLFSALIAASPVHAQNKEVQLGSQAGLGDSADPLMRLSHALRADASNQQFRVTWSFVIAQSGATTTVAYNRERQTLELYSKHYNSDGFNIRHYSFSPVNDESIYKLAKSYKDNEGEMTGPLIDELAFFPRLTEFGVQKRDLGSRCVSC